MTIRYGCNRTSHECEQCRLSDHPDFVRTGLWAGSKTDRTNKLFGIRELVTNKGLPLLLIKITTEAIARIDLAIAEEKEAVEGFTVGGKEQRYSLPHR